ncbi:DUF6702 family protein [Dyadobacter psychrotolerans]|uniref:Uncharacterized protein n=1 Tax=Dyadobacter psychrotolerans TaxID=2541721 RepID=A0A4R5DRH3_9BACT|nr:DUF6702 family protein [Dyadobacter psychrotolerans]TDE13665.1 hypothetical protein E0F88_17330 [Dyadobacter psychrotolerans]
MDKGKREEGGWENFYLMAQKKARFGLVLSSILLSSLLFFSASPKHEYHVSVTQMQYNPAIKTFEISIRIFTDDLEKGLAADNGNKRFLIKNNDQNDPFIERYIRKNFLLTDHLKKVAALRYIGKEQEEDATWVYLEIPFQTTLDGCKLQNSILSEAFEDQVNMTNLKYTSDKKTFLFKKGQLVQSL